MANENITFDKLPQAVGYLTEQVERIHKIVAALQPQTAIDKHRIVEIDEACKITRKAKPTIYILAHKGSSRPTSVARNSTSMKMSCCNRLSRDESRYRLSTSKSKRHKFSWREEQKC